MGFNIVEGEPAPPGRFTLSSYIPNTFEVEALSFKLRSRLVLVPRSSNLLAILLEVPLSIPFPFS